MSKTLVDVTDIIFIPRHFYFFVLYFTTAKHPLKWETAITQEDKMYSNSINVETFFSVYVCLFLILTFAKGIFFQMALQKFLFLRY